MKTAVITSIGKMAFEQRDIPEPRDNEALVKLKADIVKAAVRIS